MKQKHAAAALLLSALLCTGCTAAESSAPESSPDTEPPLVVTETIPDPGIPEESQSESDPESEQTILGTDIPVPDSPPVSEPPVIPAAESYTAYISAEGWFTATVRAKMPDYVSDETTERGAVLQLFQDVPFFMILGPEICGQLTVGNTYAFHVCEQELTTERSYLFEDGMLSPEAIIHSYVQIDSIRKPEDNETGLECWNVYYNIVS